VETPSPVALEVGRYTAPRLAAGAAACLVVAVSAIGVVASTDPGVVGVALGFVVAVALAVPGLVFTVAARASRGARMLVDDRGLTWDAGAATWHASWDELSAVGLTVLRSGGRIGSAGAPPSDRIVRIGMAFRAEDADAGRPPLRRLRTESGPAPFTHRMAFAARPGWAAGIERALHAFAGERFAGVEVQDARGRPVER
jgi:hypothetical protein